MESIRTVISAVCVISAAISIIEGLTAGTRLKSQIKFLLNLVFVTVTLTPLLKGTMKLELPDLKDYTLAEYSQAEELYNEQLKAKTGENISAVLLSQLEAAGIECSYIETSVNISETNSIYITSVTVSTDNFQAAARVIKNSLGEETEVINEGR